MKAADLLGAYLHEAARRDARVEARVTELRREELVARDGHAELTGTGRESVVTLRLWRAGRTAVITAPAHAAPGPVVEAACSLAANGQAQDERDAVAPAAASAADRQEPRPLAKDHDFFVAATLPDRQADRELEQEIRCAQTGTTVSFATAAGLASYRTTTASLTYRVTSHRSASGPVHTTRTGHAPDAVALRARFGTEVQGPSLRDVAVLGASAATSVAALPETVLFEGHVAAKLLALFAKGLNAEAVAERRSRLVDRLGHTVASDAVTIVDDPTAGDAPGFATFDDEGNPAHARTLVDRGRLTGYLGGSGYRQVPGAATGNAWSYAPGSPPRPAPSNLWVRPGDMPAPGIPLLRIVQAHGMHMSNDITGDFSMGAEGIVERDGELYAAPGLTVAGNVFTVFRTITWSGPRVHWSSSGRSYVGSPDLITTDVSIGA